LAAKEDKRTIASQLIAESIERTKREQEEEAIARAKDEERQDREAIERANEELKR
jgi:hypothetical protein